LLLEAPVRYILCVAAVLWAAILWPAGPASAQIRQEVVDLPTRPGVTVRTVLLTPPQPQAVAVLLAGGHGGLRIYPTGSMAWGDGNFLVRTRQLFADQGLMVAVVDAPSDRLRPPFLAGWRDSAEHAADLQAVISALRRQTQRPVWLVGTSRGTQSAAHAAVSLPPPEGPDGIVLTSTILVDDNTLAVPRMALARIRVPVLVVHHEQDGCELCRFQDLPALTAGLTHVPRQAVMTVRGGHNTGPACAAMAYHGFNGLEAEVVGRIASWMLAR
jgi:pimeloyl-ACP methyl ester carboxylesterase